MQRVLWAPYQEPDRNLGFYTPSRSLPPEAYSRRWSTRALGSRIGGTAQGTYVPTADSLYGPIDSGLQCEA